MKKDISLDVKGMHCQSCEMLITEELKELHGVSDVRVSQKDSSAIMRMDPKLVSMSEILDAVKRAGYSAHTKQNGEALVGKPIKITIETTTDAFPAHELIQLFEQNKTDVDSKPALASNKRIKLIFQVCIAPRVRDLLNVLLKVPGVTLANVNFAAEKRVSFLMNRLPVVQI